MSILTILSVFIFFILVPGLGAFSVRRRWRLVRGRLLEAGCMPRVSYHDYTSWEHETGGGVIGVRRMLACIDAVEGDDTLWVSNAELSAAIDMHQQKVVLLSGVQDDLLAGGMDEPAVSPVVLPWKRMLMISQGMQVFVSGLLYSEGGQLRFRDNPQQPLLVFIFEGDPGMLLYRGVWNSRQRNEYFNQFTPGSLILGSAALIFQAFVFLSDPDAYFLGLVALTMGFVPVLPLLPPGVAGYFLFRRLWRYGRRLRSQRDLLKVPEKLCSQGEKIGLTCCLDDGSASDRIQTISLAMHPEGAQWQLMINKTDDPLFISVRYPQNPAGIRHKLNRLAHLVEALAVILFGLALAVNWYLMFVLLSYLV